MEKVTITSMTLEEYRTRVVNECGRIKFVASEDMKMLFACDDDGDKIEIAQPISNVFESLKDGELADELIYIEELGHEYLYDTPKTINGVIDMA